MITLRYSLVLLHHTHSLSQGCILGKLHCAEADVLVQRLHSVLLGREDFDSPHMRVPPILVVGHDSQLQAVCFQETPALSTSMRHTIEEHNRLTIVP